MLYDNYSLVFGAVQDVQKKYAGVGHPVYNLQNHLRWLITLD